MREVFINNYRLSGVRIFYRGLAPTIIRSFAIDSICLPAFDYLNIKIVHRYKSE